MVVENVFENRFALAGDLRAMGAGIRIAGRAAMIQGVDHLRGAHVQARDMRGGAALVLAGLAARGETLVEGVGLIDRGYAQMEKKLSGLGADIRRLTITDSSN